MYYRVNHKKVLKALLIMAMPFLTVLIVLTMIIGTSASSEEAVTLMDICINHYNITAKYTGDEYRWVAGCREQIYNVRHSAAFEAPDDASDEDKAEYRTKEIKASALLYYWWQTHDSSFLEDTDEQYELLAGSISGSDITAADYSYSDDPTWNNVSSTFVLRLDDASIYQIYAAAVKASAKIYSSDLFSDYEENYLKYLDEGSSEVWNRIFSDAVGYFQLYEGEDLYQCTDVAHWRFWLTYGKDWKGAGNGNECAYKIVASYPDEFELSSTPAAGAVFSYQTYNHTGFIEKYDPDTGTVWYTDGNFTNAVTGQKKGIRINYQEDISYFEKRQTVYAVPKG